ncbi:ABC transporter substrate-binding protein [Sporolactobacillus terrae]|uniref:ABC transporter substrate-binding protein n=1 Tax=Sporolactobacillus terrae TaxID=269673 RepID=A0A5K7X1S1_9BACL|nr:ABC transporter substrate-binding protein [Sporolactobacillus terrae]BBN99969.1 ABC transporter substrate-binding protein [Sporolactobacillus terrae]
MESVKKDMKCLSLYLVALAMLVGLLTGCSQSSSKSDASRSTATTSNQLKNDKTMVDSTGAKVKVPSQINKIADAWPAHNEIVAMLGSADKIVATIDSKQQYPWLYKVFPEMNKAQTLFTQTTVNTEQLAAQKPDIIFTSVNPQFVSKTKELKIPTMQLIFQNYNDLKKVITTTAQALGGDAQNKADQYNAYLTNKLKEVKAKTSQIPDAQKPKILHIGTFKPLVIDGKDTIVDEWIQAAGGKNAAEISGNQKPASMEQIIKWDPDMIIVGKTAFSDQQNAIKSLDTLYKNEQWKRISAVKNKNVYINPMGAFLWDRYGMESALQFQWLAKQLHPDQFQNFDMVKETRQFYKTFMNYDLSKEEANKILNAQNP